MGFKDYIFIRRVGHHLEYKFSKFRPDLVKMVSSKALSTTLVTPLPSNGPTNIRPPPPAPAQMPQCWIYIIQCVTLEVTLTGILPDKWDEPSGIIDEPGGHADDWTLRSRRCKREQTSQDMADGKCFA